MEVFDKQGHEIIAESIKDRKFYLALADFEDGWGFGEEPVYDGTVGEIFGYIAENYKTFVVEDANGDIEHKDKFYKAVTEPTNMVFVQFKQRGTPIDERIIRQYLMVTGITPNVGLENQTWWEKNEMNDTGMKKLVCENISPKKLNIGSQETLSWLLVF